MAMTDQFAVHPIGDDPMIGLGHRPRLDQDSVIRIIMGANKQTVRKYMDAFAKSDHAAVLSCLTEGVVWEIPGAFHVTGKDAFDKEIENDAFVGSPTITISRLIEEDDVVVAEGSVRSVKKDGAPFEAAFCDVFVMKDSKITHLTSYLMEKRVQG
jgi:ketosteroid isomerase-like protein